MLNNFSPASNRLTKILRENAALDNHKNAVKIYKIGDDIERIFNISFEKMNSIVESDLSRTMKINFLLILKTEVESKLFSFFIFNIIDLSDSQLSLSLCMNISKTKYKQSLKKVS